MRDMTGSETEEISAPFALHLGDCIEVMRTLADCSVDAIVTDPPYELGFMGKGWDATGIANNVDMWREALRVLKPGGHLLAFSGSRTYHRMTVAIEDAGFEIRDQIMWVYGSGMPKSMNLDRLRGKGICGCEEGAAAPTQRDLRSVPSANVSSPQSADEERGEVLLSGLPKQGAPAAGRSELSDSEIWTRQPGMEGRRDQVQEEGQLQRHPVCESAGSAQAHGARGRVHHGASAGDGGMVRLPADENGSGAPRRPRPDQERQVEPGALADECEPQALGAWSICGGCGLPVVPQGLGTALKPAHEPICVARKPLAKGLTVAGNVLKFGTGAVNIDGCRVHGEDAQGGAYTVKRLKPGATLNATGGNWRPEGDDAQLYHGETKPGRWPANIIHDGSPEVVALFPAEAGQQAALKTRNSDKTRNTFGEFAGTKDADFAPHDERGSAARFFYCAKASRADRNAGLLSSGAPAVGTEATMRQCETADWSTRNGNHHPTVKPTDLMAYLVRLVTASGGLVLDPFMGSGSTGKACMREGFCFVGIDMTPEYVEIARGRITHELAVVTAAAREASTPPPQLDLFVEEA